jgi:hypothetical protein
MVLSKQTPTTLAAYELVLYSTAAGVSLLTFLYVVLPATALTALAAFLASFYLLINNAVAQHWCSLEYHRLVVGRGIGEYMPAFLYQLLTQTSLHERWTADSSFGLGYRHLLLYFLPLTEEQLHAFLERLAPHHVHQLRRRGLGHFLLSPNLMRIVTGDERYPVVSTTEEAVAPQKRLLFDEEDDDDSSSSMGLELVTIYFTGGLSDAQAVTLARSLDLPPANSTPATTRTTVLPSYTAPPPPLLLPEDVQEAYAEELERVLNEAISGSLYDSVWTPTKTYVTDFALFGMSTIAWYGSRVSVLCSGVGFWMRPNRTSSHRNMEWAV